MFKNMPQYALKRPKYYTPNEVSIHNTLKDIWVSFLGKVYDLTALCEANAGKVYEEFRKIEPRSLMYCNSILLYYFISIVYFASLSSQSCLYIVILLHKVVFYVSKAQKTSNFGLNEANLSSRSLEVKRIM